LYPLPRSY